MPTGAGYECSCHPGFRLHNDWRTCINLDPYANGLAIAQEAADAVANPVADAASNAVADDRYGLATAGGGGGGGGGGGEGSDELNDRCKARNPCAQICRDTGECGFPSLEPNCCSFS